MKDWTEGCGSETFIHFGRIGDRGLSSPDTDQCVDALAVELGRDLDDPYRNADTVRDLGYDRLQ